MNPPQAAHFMCNGSTPPTATVRITCQPGYATNRSYNGNAENLTYGYNSAIILFSYCGMSIQGIPPAGDVISLSGTGVTRVHLEQNMVNYHVIPTVLEKSVYLSYNFSIPSMSSDDSSYNKSVYIDNNNKVMKKDPRELFEGEALVVINGEYNNCQFTYSGSKNLEKVLGDCKVTCTYKNGVLQSCQ